MRRRLSSVIVGAALGRLAAVPARLFVAVPAGLFAAAPAWAGDIRPFGLNSWGQILAEHAGRPLIVHFWSLGCAPCLAEMPHWQAQAAEAGADLAAVNTDGFDEIAAVRRALQRFGGAGADNWAFADDDHDRLRFQVDRTWTGVLPMRRIIDKAGAATTRIGAAVPP